MDNNDILLSNEERNKELFEYEMTEVLLNLKGEVAKMTKNNLNHFTPDVHVISPTFISSVKSEQNAVKLNTDMNAINTSISIRINQMDKVGPVSKKTVAVPERIESLTGYFERQESFDVRSDISFLNKKIDIPDTDLTGTIVDRNNLEKPSGKSFKVNHNKLDFKGVGAKATLRPIALSLPYLKSGSKISDLNNVAIDKISVDSNKTFYFDAIQKPSKRIGKITVDIPVKKETIIKGLDIKEGTALSFDNDLLERIRSSNENINLSNDISEKLSNKSYSFQSRIPSITTKAKRADIHIPPKYKYTVTAFNAQVNVNVALETEKASSDYVSNIIGKAEKLKNELSIEFSDSKKIIDPVYYLEKRFGFDFSKLDISNTITFNPGNDQRYNAQFPDVSGYAADILNSIND